MHDPLALAYVEFHLDPESGHLAFGFVRLHEADAPKDADFGSRARARSNPVLSVIAALAGTSAAMLRLARPVVRAANGHIIAEGGVHASVSPAPWKQVDGLIHLREWSVPGRDVERGLIDLYVTPCAEYRGIERVDEDRTAEAAARLAAVRLDLTAALTELVSQELGVTVAVHLDPATWEESATPVTGADAWRMRGVVQDPAPLSLSDAIHTGEDNARQRYIEVETFGGEAARATLIPGTKAGYRVDSIRLQIRAKNGRLRPGPEIPAERFEALVEAAHTLRGPPSLEE